MTIEPGLNSTNAAPTGSESKIQVRFTVSRDSKYYVFARVNCPSADDDSFWVKIDDGEFVTANGLRTVGWDWVQLIGALIDKIGITTYVFGPTSLGKEAINLGDE